MDKIKFNTNEYVLVKLSKDAKMRLKLDYYKTWEGLKLKGTTPQYIPPEEDENGYSKWQLWDLMGSLGKCCRLGAIPPFETDIFLCVD